MRKLALAAFASIFAIATLPAQASQADRASDKLNIEEAQPAPYSGHIVSRGEVLNDEDKHQDAEKAPYSGQLVIRGLVVKPDDNRG